MTGAIEVTVDQLPHAKGLDLPRPATADAAGLDLVAAVEATTVLAPGARLAVPTGLRLAIPTGYEGQVRPRSGLALRHGVTVVNAPGTIDADYRGELMVALVNLGDAPFPIERGMRVAQIVFAPVTRAALVLGNVTPAATKRGAGGFGSTGLADEAPAAEERTA